MSSRSLESRKRKLSKEIRDFADYRWKLHLFNFRLNWITIIGALALSAGVTFAGIYDDAKTAAVLGVAIFFIIGLQNAFPLSEKAEFYRIVVAESENLQDTLKYKVDSRTQLAAVLKKFETLREFAAKKRPKGREMKAVSEMYKETGSSA